MKKNELRALREKSPTELTKMVAEKSREAESLVIKMASSEEKNLKKAKNLRKEIAQILTIISEKEILEKEDKDKKNLS